MRAAAVDIGTNTVRLLATEDGRDVRRLTSVVGLGEGAATSGRLGEVPMRRALAALEAFAPFVARADRAKAVATAASRNAANREEFFDRVADVLGLRPELITGDEEAALAFAGATSGRRDPPFTVVDIGGGSTEVVGGEERPAVSQSLPIGSISLTETTNLVPPVRPEDVERASERARAALDSVPAAGPTTVLGVAGTFTSLVALAFGLAEYDPEVVHDAVLPAAFVDDLIVRLSALSVSQISALPTMEPGRAPYILGGAVLARSVMEALGVDSVIVSERDLLDGIVASLMAQ